MGNLRWAPVIERVRRLGQESGERRAVLTPTEFRAPWAFGEARERGACPCAGASSSLLGLLLGVGLGRRFLGWPERPLFAVCPGGSSGRQALLECLEQIDDLSFGGFGGDGDLL